MTKPMTRWRAERMVEKFHPNWKKVVTKRKFTRWLAKMPLPLRRLTNSGDPKDAIFLLDCFESDERPEDFLWNELVRLKLWR